MDINDGGFDLSELTRSIQSLKRLTISAKQLAILNHYLDAIENLLTLSSHNIRKEPVAIKLESVEGLSQEEMLRNGGSQTKDEKFMPEEMGGAGRSGSGDPRFIRERLQHMDRAKVIRVAESIAPVLRDETQRRLSEARSLDDTSLYTALEAALKELQDLYGWTDTQVEVAISNS